MRILTTALACLALLAASLPARADDSISSDRPDVANSPDVVGPGRFQLEFGPQGMSSKDQGVRVRSLSTPFLLRVGLSENWELRLDGDGWQNSHASNAPSAHGWGDLGLGAKWHLGDGNADKGLPAMALIGTVTYATGSAAFRGQGSRPELDLALSWDLPAGFDLSVMPGLYRDRNDQGRSYTGGLLAVSLGRDLGAGLHGFLEVAGQQLASAKNGGKVVTLDTGLSYQLTPDLQIDAAIYRGISKQAPDWQWTVGVSVRF